MNNDKKSEANEILMEAEVLAYQKQYNQAAKILCKNNYIDRCIQMFSDLRMVY